MRGTWLGKVLGRGEDATAAERLMEAAETGEWDTVLSSARRMLRRQPEEVEVLALAGRAFLETTPPEALAAGEAEAGGWLDTALRLAPTHRNALYYRGLLAWLRQRPDEAATLWRRALEAHPEDREVRDALVKVWVDAGRVPEWGVPVVESTLLDGER
ncbi:MAG: tetratricopeptide repeat protein [Armatimonadetes bacterium]|nr:tetratricopeptide repeat protein [Armatimonadota bacterium]